MTPISEFVNKNLTGWEEVVMPEEVLLLLNMTKEFNVSYLNKDGINVIASVRNEGHKDFVHVTIGAMPSLNKEVTNWERYININAPFVLKEIFPNLKFKSFPDPQFAGLVKHYSSV